LCIYHCKVATFSKFFQKTKLIFLILYRNSRVLSNCDIRFVLFIIYSIPSLLWWWSIKLLNAFLLKTYIFLHNHPPMNSPNLKSFQLVLLDCWLWKASKSPLLICTTSYDANKTWLTKTWLFFLNWLNDTFVTSINLSDFCDLLASLTKPLLTFFVVVIMSKKAKNVIFLDQWW